MSNAPVDIPAYDGSPYVGPQPFLESQEPIFCGRDREKNDLSSLIVANSEVLVHAQSGAGKSSLLNAGVIPQLKRKGFVVRPVTRVRAERVDIHSGAKIANIFMFNALSAWTDPQQNFDKNAGVTLADFLGLDKRPERESEEKFGDQPENPEVLSTQAVEKRPPELLIFDQLEEIFDTWPEKWAEREDFFSQISDALERGKHLRILFAIREDYLARLFPCLEILPRRMRARFRLDPLNKTSAVHAVVDPLRQIKSPRRTFASGVANALVENLSRVRIKESDGNVREIIGEFVEPLQVSLVCEDLWRQLPPDILEISETVIRDYGNIDDTLSAYYKTCLKEVLSSDVSEGKLRGLFSQVLITAEGTRGIVYRGKDRTGGILNSAVEKLRSLHLLRQENRAGGGWYELSHDRFIGPIQQSNEEWLAGQGPSPETKIRLTQAVRTWLGSERSKEKLLGSADLEEAKKWVQSAGVDGFGLPPQLQALIGESEIEILARSAARTRIATLLFAFSAFCLLLTVIVGWFAIRQATSEELADRARYQEKLAARRRLLLGLQSVAYNESASSVGALDDALQFALLSQDLHKNDTDNVNITTVAFDTQQVRFATSNTDGTIHIWEATSEYAPSNSLTTYEPAKNPTPVFTRERRAEQHSIYDPSLGQQVIETAVKDESKINTTRSCIASQTVPVSKETKLKHLWGGGNVNLILTLESEKAPSQLLTAALSPDGRYVVTRDISGSMRLWDVDGRCQVGSWPDGGDAGHAAAFSLDGKFLVVANEDGDAQLLSFDGKSIHTVGSLTCSASEAARCGRPCDTFATRSISWSQNELVAVANSTGVTVWDAQKQTCIQSISSNEISIAALSSDGKFLATGSVSGSVKVWNLPDETRNGRGGGNGALQKTEKPLFDSNSLKEPVSAEPVSALVFNKSGTLLASASVAGTTTIWKTYTKTEGVTLSNQKGIIGMIFSPNDTYLTAVSGLRTIGKHSLDVKNSKHLAAELIFGDQDAYKEFPMKPARCLELIREQIKRKAPAVPLRDSLIDSANADCLVIQ